MSLDINIPVSRVVEEFRMSRHIFRYIKIECRVRYKILEPAKRITFIIVIDVRYIVEKKEHLILYNMKCATI